MNENFDHWMNVLNNNIGRIADAMEKSCSGQSSRAECTISGSGATTPVDPCSGPSATSLADDAGSTTTSDSARRALADNNRPAWLTREMCESLPEGTERVWWSNNVALAYAFPAKLTADHDSPEWDVDCGWTEQELEASRYHKVYHLPPAAKGEGDAKPDAGRAEGVKPTCTKCNGPCRPFYNDNNRWWCERCQRGITTPAPKPSPGEVAEGIVRDVFGDVTDIHIIRLKSAIEAAIVRERSYPT